MNSSKDLYLYNISDTDALVLDISVKVLRTIYGIGLFINFMILGILGQIELKNNIYSFIKVKLFIKILIFIVLIINPISCSICKKSFYDEYIKLALKHYTSMILDSLSLELACLEILIAYERLYFLVNRKKLQLNTYICIIFITTISAMYGVRYILAIEFKPIDSDSVIYFRDFTEFGIEYGKLMNVTKLIIDAILIISYIIIVIALTVKFKLIMNKIKRIAGDQNDLIKRERLLTKSIISIGVCYMLTMVLQGVAFGLNFLEISMQTYVFNLIIIRRSFYALSSLILALSPIFIIYFDRIVTKSFSHFFSTL